MLVRRACGMCFSVLVELFIVIYSLVSKGRVSLFGSVFSLAIFKRSFFSQLLTNVSVALVHLSVAF